MLRIKRSWIITGIILVLLNTCCAFLGQPLLRIPIGEGYARGLFTIYHGHWSAGGGGWIDLTPRVYVYERVHGADPWSFRVLKYGYARDNQYVYCGQRIDFDVETLTVISAEFAKDKNNVRGRNCLLQLKQIAIDRAPESFDPASFVDLGCDFVRDRTGVYRLDTGGVGQSEKRPFSKTMWRVDVAIRMDIVDPESFHLIKGRSEPCTFTDQQFTYRTRVHTEEGESIDAHLYIAEHHSTTTFRRLGCGFIQTENGIFWYEQQLPYADSATFEVLVKKDDKACRFGYYARDANHVYYCSRIVEGADPKTMRVLDAPTSARYAYYAYDAQHKYEQGQDIAKSMEPAYARKHFDEAFAAWQRLLQQ